MHSLSRQQIVGLVFITLVWGLNWPVMKLGVTDYPPLTFRTISMWLGLPVMALGLVLRKAPFRVPRAHWRELFWLAVFNMFIWHALIIIAVKSLSSGRAAILGYSMPVFSAVLGAWLFGQRLSGRAWAGVGAAALGVVLLLWHEITNLAGHPVAVMYALISAVAWALGVHLMRRTRLTVPTLTISFWMTVMTALVMTVLSILFEQAQWKMPAATTWGAIGFNAVLIFGVVQTLWLSMARRLTPVASTRSVMMIPVLGVFSGAGLLGEVLHWQDWAAVLLMVLAIASVLLPARPAP
jgi:drug/metabolite transporter (DMT)-like permease